MADCLLSPRFLKYFPISPFILYYCYVNCFSTVKFQLLIVSIHGIFQARVLEGGAISFSTGKQWADSKPWKGEGGAGEHVSKGAARSLCPCLGKQASLCPLPHPCPSAELTAREKFVVKRAAGKLFLAFPQPH